MAHAQDGFAFEGQGVLERVDTFTTSNGKTIYTMVISVAGSIPHLSNDFVMSALDQ